ncbi:MAG: response regulator [Deltaproteobacteria bacterium]|nr:response regulator [Deltaproteobacteria bacterium]
MSAPLSNKTVKFHSLTVILAIAFVSVSVLVLLIASGLELYFSYNNQKKQVIAQQQLIARDAANSVKAYIHKKIETLKTAAILGNLTSPDREDQRLVMDKLLGLDPSFRQLILFDNNAREIQRASRISKILTDQIKAVDIEKIRLELKQINIFISTVYIDSSNNEPLMTVAIPLTDVLDTYQGFITAEINLKFMWELVGTMKIGKAGVAYVVDKKGNLLAFGDTGRVLKGENLKNLHEVSRYIHSNLSSEKTNGEITKGIKDNQVVAVYAELGNPDWAVIVELPAVEAFRDIIDSLKRTIIFLFSCLILAVLISIFLSKKITKPVIDLRDAARKVGEGDLNSHIEITSDDEIGELAKSFNQMIVDLKRTTVSRDELAEEILERKNIETALTEAKKQAESALEAKGQFLANMSHEIRTPLNAIIGFTRLLKETRLDEMQQDYLATMQTSGNMLLSLINDILDFSKVQEKRYELESIEFDFMYLIESIFSMIRSKMIGSAVDVLYRLDSGPRYFKGDPTRIRQILINLIGNALKFTEKGEIFTTIGPAPEDTMGEGEPGVMRTIRISIRDTGIGIPENKKEAIFESFTQADVSTTRKYGGTGLGLSITKAFVEKMGGRIWVESSEGKGSEFIFTLKLEQAKPIIDKEIEPVSHDALIGKRALIVDDNINAGEIFSEYCTTARMEVMLVAHSGEEALQYLAEAYTMPDIIISDMMMPEMDGYGFIEKIRHDENLKNLKIIAATSEAIPGQSMNARIKGFDGYLSKPILRKEMINVIRTVLGDKRKEKSNIVTRHMAEEISYKGLKVMVVEDNPINMKLMDTLLSKYGIIIDKAGNGKEAIEMLRKDNPYDIIFMDMQMPEMNGIDATIIIRSEICKDTPVIALSAAVLKEDRENATEAGMNDFLEKPVNVEKLKEVLKKYSK